MLRKVPQPSQSIKKDQEIQCNDLPWFLFSTKQQMGKLVKLCYCADNFMDVTVKLMFAKEAAFFVLVTAKEKIVSS